MAIEDFFSAEEQERQAALTRSWEAAKRDLANPEIEARVQAKLAELDTRAPGLGMTGDEFLREFAPHLAVDAR